MARDWREARLGEVVTLKRGYDLPTATRNGQGGVPVVSSSGVSGYHDEPKVQPPGVVTGRYGTVGDVFYLEEPFWPLNTSLYVQSFHGNHPRFVYYFLQSIDYTRYSDKTGVPGINRNDIHRIRVAVPPLPEQRKIAEILGTWDEAIALVERRIAAARQRKKGLMQQLLTGRRRFTEFEGQPWREMRLGEVFRERRDRGFDHLPLLSITDDGIVYRDELERRDTSSADKSRYLRICKGDIGYNTMRMWQGRSAISELQGIVSPAYTVCVPPPTVDAYFMSYLFKLPSVVLIFRRHSQGLVSDVWNLKYRSFARIRLKLPDLREQHRISAVLRACDEQIDLLNRKLSAMQQQKRGLMQRLLTGRVRV